MRIGILAENEGLCFIRKTHFTIGEYKFACRKCRRRQAQESAVDPLVVIIKECDECAARRTHTEVAGGNGTALLIVENADAPVLESGDGIAAVIDDQQFEIAIILGQH